MSGSSGSVSSGSSSGSSSAANYGFGVGLAGGASTAVAQQGQGVAALLVMLAVLCFIFAYCCWGAPFCRSLCRRHCCCRLEDTDSESGGFGGPGSATTGNTDQAMLATPTIILLPHGRMLVVDGTIFTQFQAENTGLDLVELGESVMRAQRNPSGVSRHQLQNSQGSIIEMDAETPSKDSMGSLGCFPPPTYESIYGKDEGGDMPPSYSDILLHRFANLPFEIEMQDFGGRDSKEEIEMRSLENCTHIIGNPINSLTYPFGGAAGCPLTSYSSQSLPRQPASATGPRNPSLISNPLDGYYVDNELAGLYRSLQRQRRRSAATAERTRRTSICNNADAPANLECLEVEDAAVAGQLRRNDEAGRNSRTNADDRAVSENVLDNRFAHPWDQTSRSQNDAMNSRNSTRSDSRRSEEPNDLSRVNPVFARSRRSEGNVGADEAIRTRRESRISVDEINWNLNNLDVRYNSDEEGSLNDCSDRHNDECDEAAGAEDDPSNFKALADIRESRV